MNRRGLPQGQERTVSYQPEERYWTDYLRIALPVVGLLLMLGLFWYWASAVIGNGDDDDKTPTAVQGLVITATSVPATNTAQVNLSVQTTTSEATEETSSDNSGTTGTATNGGTGENSKPAGKGFDKDQLVLTNTGEVNLRKEPSTDSDVVDVLAENTELTVTEPATKKDSEGYYWVGVTTEDGLEGYVADKFLDPSE